MDNTPDKGNTTSTSVKQDVDVRVKVGLMFGLIGAFFVGFAMLYSIDPCSVDQAFAKSGTAPITCEIPVKPPQCVCGDGACSALCKEQISCPQDCAGLPYCGDGIIQVSIGEQCDGADLGGATCGGLQVSCDTGHQKCNAIFEYSEFCSQSPYGTPCTYGDASGICGYSQCLIMETQECVGTSVVTCDAYCRFNTSACNGVWQTEAQTAPDELNRWQGNCSVGQSCYSTFPSCVQAGSSNAYCNSSTDVVDCSPICGSNFPELYCDQCSHCSDGIQNCNETGVDIGGTCAPVCGDGEIEAGEECDGANLNGQSCVTQGFAGGTLACDSTSCVFDTSLCTPVCTDGEQRCSTPPGPFRTEVCVDGAWEAEAQTVPDSKPDIEGIQWEGDCYMGLSCDSDNSRACARDASDLNDWYCYGIEPLECSLSCQEEWPEAWDSLCSAGCTGQPDGAACVTDDQQEGICQSETCIGYEYTLNLEWNSATGAPNDLDLYLFVENQGVVYKGNQGPVGGTVFISDRQSNGETVTEQIVFTDTPLSGVRYAVYVKNTSGEAWNDNPRVTLEDVGGGIYNAIYRPDDTCTALPWWQVFSTNPSFFLFHTDGTRMMEDGGIHGVTLDSTTANLDRMGMPFEAPGDYCCSSDEQCSQTCDVASNTCVAPPHCTNGILDADEEGLDCGGVDCPACSPQTGDCQSVCEQFFGTENVVSSFCDSASDTCVDGATSPNKSECSVDDNDVTCSGTSNCCCVVGLPSCI
ncbi:hypothetical protein ACFL0L_03160 [Patescibacteria group bacterium]